MSLRRPITAAVAVVLAAPTLALPSSALAAPLPPPPPPPPPPATAPVAQPGTPAASAGAPVTSAAPGVAPSHAARLRTGAAVLRGRVIRVRVSCTPAGRVALRRAGATWSTRTRFCSSSPRRLTFRLSGHQAARVRHAGRLALTLHYHGPNGTAEAFVTVRAS
jgi:hypothetical protein